MRIVQYLLLLLLLGTVAATVYVATQKGDFDITEQIEIKVPKSVVFHYVNDYRNWEDWSAWKQDDPKMVFSCSQNPAGKGAWLKWNGSESEGKATTLSARDSIVQKVAQSGNESTAVLKFSTIGLHTVVSWHCKGKVDFSTKIYATFNGGVDAAMRDLFQRSLFNLKTVITKEINTYNIRVNGMVNIPGTFYVRQTASCRRADLPSKVSGLMARMQRFFQKSKLPMNGRPFVMYEAVDSQNQTVTFSVCGPLREAIFLTEGSDLSTGFLNGFKAVKTTLTGDYSHREEALKKTSDYLSEKGISENTALKRVDVYIKSIGDTRSPSQWQTQILIPVSGTAAAPVPNSLPTAATQEVSAKAVPATRPLPQKNTAPPVKPNPPKSTSRVETTPP